VAFVIGSELREIVPVSIVSRHGTPQASGLDADSGVTGKNTQRFFFGERAVLAIVLRRVSVEIRLDRCRCSTA